MKRWICKLITVFTVFSLMSVLSVIEPKAVIAGNTYGYACNTAYSADYINDDGSFKNAKCTNNINEAKEVLGWGEDYVVRARDNLSPTKIVMMSGGLVYTYPERGGINTLTFSDYNNGMTSYVTHHREMKYEWTESVNGDSGKAIVSLNGIMARVDLKLVDLVPWKFVDTGRLITLGGNDRTGKNEQPFQTRIYQSHYEVSNGLLKFIWSSGWSDNGYPATYTHNLGPIDSSIPNGVYYSYDGYTFFSDRTCVNVAFTYYNYYQYLPLRSKTNLTADELNAYIDSRLGSSEQSVLRGKGQAFIDAQNKYGINAALVLSIACLESATGTSQYALERNNLFGLAAYDSDPNKATYFSSVEECINQMMGYYLKDYIDDNDWRNFGMHLGNKGSGVNVKYAADPYWGIKIGSIYYEMDKANLKDYNSVKRGLVTTHAASVYLNSDGSGLLYNTANRDNYQKVYVVPITGEAGNYYEFQSNNLVENGSIVSNGFLTYNWDNSKVYINKGDVQILNNGTSNLPSTDGLVPTGDFNFTSDVVWKDDHTLTISGAAYRPGIKITEENTLTIEAYSLDQYFTGKKHDCKVSIGSDAKSATYSFDVDLNEIANGTYRFFANTIYGKLTEYNQKDNYIKDESLPENKDVGLKTISFSKDENNIVTMSVTTKVDLPETPEKPQEPVEPIEPLHLIDSAIIKREIKEGKLYFSGYAYITNMDALEENKDNISINIELVNKLNDEAISMDVQVKSLEEPIYTGDYQAKYCYFNANVDLALLDESVYIVNIKVKNGDITAERVVRTSDTSLLYNSFDEITNSSLTIQENYAYSYRLEISNEKLPFDMSDSNKIDSVRGMAMTIINSKLNLKEDKPYLDLSFTAFARQTNISDKDKITGRIIIYDKKTGKLVKEISADQISVAGTDGLNIAIDKGYEVTYGLTNTSIDLSDLKPGQYLFLYDASFEADNKVQSGIVELSGLFNQVDLANGNYTYSLYQTAIRNRMELTINYINDEKSKEIDEVADDVASDDGKISEEQIQEHYVLNVGQEANKSN